MVVASETEKAAFAKALHLPGEPHLLGGAVAWPSFIFCWNGSGIRALGEGHDQARK